MREWPSDELEAVGAAVELEIASKLADGSTGPFTTIWVVRVGDELYVRSYRADRGLWYQSARSAGSGTIRAGGVERMVTFEHHGEADRDAIDAVYRSKYKDDPSLEPMVASDVAATTIHLVPS